MVTSNSGCQGNWETKKMPGQSGDKEELEETDVCELNDPQGPWWMLVYLGVGLVIGGAYCLYSMGASLEEVGGLVCLVFLVFVAWTCT